MKTSPTSRGPSAVTWNSALGLKVGSLTGQSSSSSSRASHVASRSTGVSNWGLRSTNVRSWSASHSKETSYSPRRAASSSMPRSVKYTLARLSRRMPRG